MEASVKFAAFDAPCRVWAVSSIHSDRDGLAALHDMLRERIVGGDRLVYLGNIFGYGADARGTVDELLAFRRWFLAFGDNDVKDYAVLRGAQEEMWRRLFELQFTLDPAEVLEWMLKRGVGGTIEAYGSDPARGLAAARAGVMPLTHWTSALRDSFAEAPGHRDLLSSIRRAAYTRDGALLFVNTGIDPERPLDAQNDTFWWEHRGFDQMETCYFGCRLVVRGYDPERRGVRLAAHTATIDGGAGFGGRPIAACITRAEGVVDILDPGPPAVRSHRRPERDRKAVPV